MVVQEKIRGVNSNNILVPGNKMCLDIGKPSLNGAQLKELYSSGDERTPKARKAYTITKQRERWTDEEHKKFLEALKLYGRAWRRIEEHIGTKTAVQIRSHAQKFFSKVVRESSSNTGSVKSIEIPPPRPKRKPLHPYPRKLIISSPKGILVSEPLEMSPSPVASVSENENRSPASVLSTVGSDITGSTTSNQNGCASPVSSAARSNPVGIFIAEQENGYPLSISSNEEEDRCPSPVTLPTNPRAQEKSLMNSEIGCKDLASAKDNKSPAPVTSLKLFGRTVLVTDSHRPSSSFIGNTSQVHKSQPPIDVISNQVDLDSDVQKQAQGSPRNTIQSLLQEGQCKSTWNEFPLAAPPLFYYMQFQQDRNPAGTAIPMPWWALYGNFQFPCIHSPIMNMRYATSDSFIEPSDNKDTNKDGSWTDSNGASSEVGVGDKNGDVIDSQSKEKNKEPTAIFHLKASENLASSNRGSILQNCSKGFVPYKRCVAERDVQQQKIDSEEREGQRTRLCL